jgi:signal transduction histidine kinase
LAFISHEIENTLVGSPRAPRPAAVRLFAGFQKFSFFLPQVQRYRWLASTNQVWVFGVPDGIVPDIPNITYIPIPEGHALAREWFLVADSAQAPVALVAEELRDFPPPPGQPPAAPPRFFRGIWTYDPRLVRLLVQSVCQELQLDPPAAGLIDRKDALDQLARTTTRVIRRMEQSQLELQQQQQVQEDYVHMVIHDLRGALTGVVGSLELLTSGKVIDPADQQMLIHNSLLNSQHMARMISNVLDVYKIEAGQMNLNRHPVDVAELLDRVVHRWQNTLAWEEKRLELSLPEILPLILADRDLLERVIDNLLSNASKYGTVVHLRAAVKSGAILISVVDNGPGIPPQDRQRIFSKFNQANLGSAQRKGTGLGLAFCKLAVEAHQGAIEVQDTPGGGATFIVRLPLAARRARAAR